VVAAVAAVALTASALAEGEGWLTNYPKALAQAKAEKKLLLINFNGSDWSQVAKKQTAEVFSTKEFKDYAAQNLVLLEVDSPRTKELPAELKDHHRELISKFAIRSFPTLILIDGEGEEQSRFLGYGGGGAAKVIAKIDAFRK
jgi:protein disulfide-isomerase